MKEISNKANNKDQMEIEKLINRFEVWKQRYGHSDESIVEFVNRNSHHVLVLSSGEVNDIVILINFLSFLSKSLISKRAYRLMYGTINQVYIRNKAMIEENINYDDRNQRELISSVAIAYHNNGKPKETLDILKLISNNLTSIEKEIWKEALVRTLSNRTLMINVVYILFVLSTLFLFVTAFQNLPDSKEVILAVFLLVLGGLGLARSIAYRKILASFNTVSWPKEILFYEWCISTTLVVLYVLYSTWIFLLLIVLSSFIFRSLLLKKMGLG